MTPVEKLREAERLLIEVRDDPDSPYSAALISSDVVDTLRIITGYDDKKETIELTAEMLRDLLDGETLEFWQGNDISIKLDPKIGPFGLGILVGKSLRDREKIKDAETRLEGDGK